jgi:lysozyme
MYSGYDIASLQGNVDFEAVASSGASFIIHRCGIGNSGLDPKYGSNVAKARAAGLKVAAYNFIYPLPPLASQPLRDPLLQAQYHFKATGADIVTCTDLEWPMPVDWPKWNTSAQQIIDWSLTYLQEYKRISGQNCIIYTYPDFANHIKLPAEFTNYKLWIASYQPTAPYVPSPWGANDWVLWQNSGGTAKLPGTGVPVDTDVAKDLSIFDLSAPAAPVSEPIPDHQPEPVPTPVVITQHDPPPPVVAPAPQPIQTASLSLAGVWSLIVALINKLLGKK